MVRLLCSALLLAVGLPAYAASFDCTKAKRPVEVAICSDPALSAADARMAAAYRAELSRLSSNSVGLLRVDQVQWLSYAQEVCRVNAPATTKAVAAKCLKPLYDDRVKQLRGAIAVRGGLTFLNRTQFLAKADSESADTPSGEHEGFGSMTAVWPAADTDDEEWIAWSAAIEAHMLKAAGAGQTKTFADGKEKVLPKTWDDSMAGDADSTFEAVFRSMEHGRVTTVISIYSLGRGAAHPLVSSETVTWWLKEKRALRAEDVFAEADWKHRLGALCWADLRARNAEEKFLYDEVDGPDAEKLRDVVADVTNWTLEQDGIHISYPGYSIANGNEHPDDTVATWAELKPLLQKNFVLPKPSR